MKVALDNNASMSNGAFSNGSKKYFLETAFRMQVDQCGHNMIDV